jgi:hypothetical protein
VTPVAVVLAVTLMLVACHATPAVQRGATWVGTAALPGGGSITYRINEAEGDYRGRIRIEDAAGAYDCVISAGHHAAGRFTGTYVDREGRDGMVDLRHRDDGGTGAETWVVAEDLVLGVPIRFVRDDAPAPAGE